MKRIRLKIKGGSDRAILKEEIQAILREIAIKRDGGCIFRNYPETGKCGGFRKDGQLILQFDHLNSRANAISFSDSRLGVCACKRHHLFYKRQYPSEYEKYAIDNLGQERTELLYRVRADNRPYKVDLKLALIGLRQELALLIT